MKLRHASLLLAGLLAAVSTAHAHRSWVLPAVTVLSGEDKWVAFDAAVSNSLFFPDHRGINIAQVEAKGPDGQPVELQNATTGRVRSSFELNLKQQGTYLISLKPGGGRGQGGGMGGAPGGPGAPAAGAPAAQGGPGGGQGGPGGMARGGLNGTYTGEDGKPVRWRGTPETLVSEEVAKKPDFKLRESGGRSVVTFVTLGKPSTEVLKPSGKGFEVEYLTHPNDLNTGEPGVLRLLYDGKPVAGEIAVARGDDRYRNEGGETVIKSDAEGLVKIEWPAAGRYWVEASYAAPGTLHGVPSEKTFTYIATYEVLPE